MPFPPPSYPVPYATRALLPAQGNALTNGTAYTVVLVGNKLANGTMAVDTMSGFVTSQANVNQLVGSKSELAWQYRAFRASDPNTQVRLASVAEAAGASPSTRTWTLVGNASVACDLFVDTCSVNIPGKVRMSIVVNPNDTPAVQVANLVTAINEDPDLPFTAAQGAAPTYGQEVSSVLSFPVALVSGDTLSGKVDGGSTQTLTMSATAATMTGSGAPSYAAVTAGHTLIVSFESVPYTITFAGTENTQALFLAAINAQLPAGVASGFAQNSGGAIQIVSNQKGSGATVALVSGSTDVLTSLGLSGSPTIVAGTGNVPNIAAVTAAQFAALLTATFTGGTAGSTGTANTNQSVTWATNTAGTGGSVQFTTGSIIAKIPGFDTLIHSGTTSGAGTITLTTTQNGARSHYWLDQVRFSYDDPTNATQIAAASTVAGAGVDSVANVLVQVDTTTTTLHSLAATATAGVTSGDGGIGSYAAYLASSLLPQSGKGQMGVAGCDGTSTQATAVAQSSVVNSVFFKLAPLHGSDWPPCMNAAHYTGILSSQESVYAAVNLRNYTTNQNLGTVCAFPPPFTATNQWAPADEVTLLNGGCCDIMFDASSTAFIRRDINTYSWLPPGGPTTTADYRGREGHIGPVMIQFWADFDSRANAQGLNAGNIQDNPKSGVKPIPGQVYPRMVESCANTLIQQMVGAYQNGKVLLDPSHIDDMLAATSCTKLPQGGWALTVDLRVARHNLFSQTTINEVSGPQ